MKTSVVAIVALLFISTSKAENFLTSTTPGKDIGKEITDNVNAKAQQDYEDYLDGIDGFLKSAQDTFDREFTSGMVDVSVGHNKIRYTQHCDYEYTKQEIEQPPIELECVKASYDAQFFAQTIANLSKYEISDTTTVLKNLGECEIIGGKNVYVHLDIYEDCLTGEFKTYYDQYFEQVKTEMIAKGFTWNDKEKRFEHSETIENIKDQVADLRTESVKNQ